MGRRSRMALFLLTAAWLLAGLLGPGAVASNPTAEAGSPKTVYVGDLNWYNGTGSANGYIVKYEWDFDGDGSYEWSNSLTGNATHIYSEVGTYTARFKVTDNSSFIAVDVVQITVKTKNKAPAAEAGPDKLGEVGIGLQFSGTGADMDGTIVKYEWDFLSDGDWEFVGTNGQVSYTYTSTGEYYATLRVTDNGSPAGTATDFCKVTINPVNQKPVANAGSPVTGEVGEPVLLVGKGTDPNGDISLFEWDFNGDGRYDWNSTTTGTVTTKYYETGSYTARLRVTDNAPIPLSDVSSVPITIVAKNRPPIVVGPSHLAAEAGKPVALSIFAIDPDTSGRIARVEWDFDGNGIRDSVTADGNTTATYNSSGDYTVRATVYDDQNASALWRIGVTVKSPPAGENALMKLLPTIILLLIGIGLGCAIGAGAMRSYAKSHWEKFFNPTKLDRLKMRAELEHDELAASGFRGEGGGSAAAQPPPAQQYQQHGAGYGTQQQPQYDSGGQQQYQQTGYQQQPSPQEQYPQGRGGGLEGSGFR